jgi:dipeptidase E
MNLILTSDFPITPTELVVSRVRAAGADPRIACIPPSTETDRSSFNDACQRFAAAGFRQIEYVDIDEERDDVQLAYLHEFDVVYLAGGDPVRFRYNAMRSGLAGRLRQSAVTGRLIIGASAGSMLLTRNVSIFRLQHESVDEVIATRDRFDGIGAAPYEVLPHANRRDRAFMEKVRHYSSCIDHDVVTLADGAALLHTGADRLEAVGEVHWYRAGKIVNRPSA